ncbi:emerin (Emery-Dreifuss muscular dystrophy) [Antennarius striatus]|uniref:emerin (Emery-Dreifuss muscular dystrophy) n=1 Tax=Antennarius striatus TaxID=241820 RepID=UPI0035B49B19
MESGPEKPSSDKTYYREEEEEVTYITYQSGPVSHEEYGDLVKRRVMAEPDEDRDSDEDAGFFDQNTTKAANHSSMSSRETGRKTGGSLCGFIRRLLLLAVLAAICYYIYCWVTSKEENASV